MSDEKEYYPGQDSTAAKQTYIAPQAYPGKEVTSPQITEDGLHPSYQNDAPIPAEHDLKKSPAGSRLCGLRRTTAIILLTIGILLILALGLGLGLGLGLSKASSNAGASSASPASAVATTTTPTSSTTATNTAASSAASPTISTSCPGSNGTTYTSSGHTFLLLCENDVKAPTPSDLGRVFQPTFDACINSCAAVDVSQGRSDVSAVYWVDYDDAARGTCWCIGGTSLSNNATTYYNPHNNLAWIRS